MLKLPIARLGKWHHDSYGTVEFTQQDFDAIRTNFESNARGYEPYLRYGHSQKGAGLHGAEPAQAFLKSLTQEGEVLWGNFEPTNDKVVEEVKNGMYRYGSAELIRNAKDKFTGNRLSVFLKGHTLTNEPFVPNLPRNVVADEQYLSEDGAEFQVAVLNLYDASVPESSYLPQGDSVDNTQGMLHSLMQSMMNLFKRVEELPTREEVRQIMTVVEAEADAAEGCEESSEEEMEEMPMNLAEDGAELPQEEEQAPAEAEAAPEDITEESAAEPAEEAATVVEAEPAPAVDTPEAETDMNANTEVNDAQREIDELKARLDAIQAERDAAAADAEAAKSALEERLLSDRIAAEEAARLAEEQKEVAFAQMLTDRAEALKAQGVPPVLADRAKALISALKPAVNAEQTFVLSEGAEAVDLVNGVFSLLSEASNVIDFNTHGYMLSESDVNTHSEKTENPWGDRMAALRKSNL